MGCNKSGSAAQRSKIVTHARINDDFGGLNVGGLRYSAVRDSAVRSSLSVPLD